MAKTHAGVPSIATVPSFVEDRLRETMVLGLPNDDADKPTFYFERSVQWADHDVEGHPWNWAEAPVIDTTQAPVQPICAYEFFAPLGRAGSQFTEAGDFYPSTLIVTLMEADIAAVENSSYVTVGPSQTRFWFRYYLPMYGLDGLNVYQIHFQAEDTV